MPVRADPLGLTVGAEPAAPADRAGDVGASPGAFRSPPFLVELTLFDERREPHASATATSAAKEGEAVSMPVPWHETLCHNQE